MNGYAIVAFLNSHNVSSVGALLFVAATAFILWFGADRPINQQLRYSAFGFIILLATGWLIWVTLPSYYSIEPLRGHVHEEKLLVAMVGMVVGELIGFGLALEKIAARKRACFCR